MYSYLVIGKYYHYTLHSCFMLIYDLSILIGKSLYSIFVQNDRNEKSINRYLAKNLVLESFFCDTKNFLIESWRRQRIWSPIQSKIIRLLSLQMSSVIRKCFNTFFGYNSVRIIFSHWIQSTDTDNCYKLDKPRFFFRD